MAAVDCKGIPVRKKAVRRVVAGEKKPRRTGIKKMATVAAAYTVSPRTRTPEDVVESLFKEPAHLKLVGKETEKPSQSRPENKRVWASLEKSKDEVISEVKDEVERRDPGRGKTRVVVTDGEKALQFGVQAAFVGVLLVLDLLHVLEKLWKAAGILCGDGPESADAREAWVRVHALRILHGNVSEVVRGIRQSVTKRQLKGEKRKKLLLVAAYLYRNRAFMRYDEYLAQGLPIASGTVEGACKNLVKDRFECSGARWGAFAEPLLRLRATYLSGDFDEYWKFHIAAEQRRLYGTRTWRVLGSVGKK